MPRPLLLIGTMLLALFSVLPCHAETDSGAKKVVFVAGTRSHGYGSHEHYAGCMLLAKYLKANMPDYETIVHRNGWPADGVAAFEDADSVVVYCDGGGRHVLNPHIDEFDKLMDKGVGLVCVHYGVETPKGKTGDAFLKWMGGYFETHWSVNPHWTGKFNNFPDHEITKGVKPFEVRDEWYYHMRFRPEMKGVTPILSAHPPQETMKRGDGPHSGNPHVRAAIQRGDIQHVAWAAEREGGGRGFGFTGGHFHWNWGDDNFRKVVLNAIVWTAHGEVPENGVSSETPTREQLEQNQDFPKPKPKQEKKQAKAKETPDRTPSTAVGNLDVHPEVKATLFAAEPLLLSPSNIDIDAKGRIWVCEIVNYRRHRGKRPEGDRILILEDEDGDGCADKRKVFYQGSDIDSPHGVCVLGNRVIVSSGENVISFTDEDGDDKPDKKEILFTGISGTQHDHGIHVFSFGPDGKLYFNFGNEGKQLKDTDGRFIVDKAGNEVRENRKPYQQGMVFRCNEDGSELETLGWNFRNNWMVAVDSFGTVWQSDNDDDGNQGVRINYVMEFGNFGYRDARTGAGWRSERTGKHPEKTYHQWYQNDPGVVPNLLATGAGSPTGITVYEGDLLPKVFQNQVIHCDAGPSVTRCYPTSTSGAGYTAKIVNILEGARDRWFRPSDVKVAPDGSLIVADWYDPGVGGHAMGDLNKGRIFRVVPKDHDGKYSVPTFDFESAEGAVEALKNPNNAVRHLAWKALHEMGAAAESALVDLWKNDNPRLRARALWLLGKIPGRGMHYVELAITDEDPNIRIAGLRLARQLDSVDDITIVARLAADDSAHVRRECSIALRHNKSEKMPQLWAQLAAQHDGNDRWYLEALGIGADLRWDECLDAWLVEAGRDLTTKPARDILWRSKADVTPNYLAKLITNIDTPQHELPRYFRAFDFLDGVKKDSAIATIAFNDRVGNGKRSKLIDRESLNRLKKIDLSDETQRNALTRALDASKNTTEFVRLVNRFDVQDRFPELLTLAHSKPNQPAGIDAINTLLSKGQVAMIREAIDSDSAEVSQNVLSALGNSANNQAANVLQRMVESEERDLELRRQSVKQLAKLRQGAKTLVDQIESGKLDENLKEAVAVSLSASNFRNIREKAAELFPSFQGKDNAKIPSIQELTKSRGNAERGQSVFAEAGTCAKCHIVNGKGKEVGPDLSKIGSKLSRQAMFESILYPNAGISHNYESYIVVLNDGNIVTGLLSSKTDDMVVIKNQEGVVRNIKQSDIDEMSKSPLSLMPTDLYKTMTQQQIVDVVEYLSTLKD